MGSIWIDLRQSVRTILASPRIAAAAVITLGLGIGLNTAVFTVFKSLLLNPLPYSEPDRLARIWEVNYQRGHEKFGVLAGGLVDWRALNHTFDDFAIFGGLQWLVTIKQQHGYVNTFVVSPGIFSMLGVSPIAGRTFRPEKEQRVDDPDKEVILAHHYWTEHYAGDVNAIGQQINVEGGFLYTVVGVMPAGFDFPEGVDMWTPVALGPGMHSRGGRARSAIGRLRPGVTVDDATKDLQAIEKRLEVEHPDTNKGWTATVALLQDSVLGSTKTTLVLVFAAATCVLLISCSNVAHLILVQSAARHQETALRVALGARLRRLLQQWLIEGAVIASAGGILGLVISLSLVSMLLALAPGGTPRLSEISLGPTVIAYAFAVSCGATLVFGLTPLAWFKNHTADALLKAPRQVQGRDVIRHAFLIGEIAATFVLLVVSGLLGYSLYRLHRVDLGFQPQHVLSMKLSVPISRFPVDRNRPGPGVRPYWWLVAKYNDDTLQKIRSLPQVSDAGTVSDVPVSGQDATTFIRIIDAVDSESGERTLRPETIPVARHIVSSSYFKVLGIPLVAGRLFDENDVISADEMRSTEDRRKWGVAIVNQTLARMLWPQANPLGKRLTEARFDWVSKGREVIGVVRDVRLDGAQSPSKPELYVPVGQFPGYRTHAVLKTSGDPYRIVASVRQSLADYDRDLVVSDIRSLTDIVSDATRGARFQALSLSAFAILSLFLAFVGIYGVVSFGVVRRVPEIGIRMAIGARPRDIVSDVLKSGALVAVVGLALGSLGAIATLRMIQSMLFGLSGVHGVVVGAAVAVVLAAALAASYLPARRAAGLDAAELLRQE